MPPKVVLTRRIPSNVLDKYVSNGQIELIQWDKDSPADPQWLKSQIKNADAMIVALQDAISEDLLSNSSPSLKVISTFSVGFDHVDLKAMKKRNLRLGYTPFVLDQAVAELTLTLMLNLTRQVPRAARVVREGEWNKNPWSPLAFCGPSLQGKTIGFLGFGNIAQTLVLLLRAFRPGKVIYTTSSPKPFDLESQDFSTLRKGGYSLSNDVKVENEPDKDDLARNSDVLIILASLNSSTKHIINSDFLKKMKKTAYIVNVSRGPLVDTEALAKSLEADEIAGAGLDVVENEPNLRLSAVMSFQDIPSSHPLLSPSIADKVMILPHIASATNETRQAMADLACNNALGALGIDGMEMVQEKKL